MKSRRSKQWYERRWAEVVAADPDMAFECAVFGMEEMRKRYTSRQVFDMVGRARGAVKKATVRLARGGGSVFGPWPKRPLIP